MGIFNFAPVAVLLEPGSCECVVFTHLEILNYITKSTGGKNLNFVVA